MLSAASQMWNLNFVLFTLHVPPDKTGFSAFVFSRANAVTKWEMILDKSAIWYRGYQKNVPFLKGNFSYAVGGYYFSEQIADFPKRS